MAESIGNGKVKTVAFIALTLSLWAGAGGLSETSAATGPKLPSIYDTGADGQEQIAEALSVAQRDHKRVLLQFGANWCVWCHRLHGVFEGEQEIARELQNEYELVLIDIDKTNGKMHNAAIVDRYGQPTKHGLPVLVVLDANGRQLTTRETASWEVGEDYDHAKILAFLKQWRTARVSAEEMLAEAMAQSKSQSKRTFLWFGAPWCAYCDLMVRFFASDEVAQVFGSVFVPVKIDIDRMRGGKALAIQYGRSEKDGLPFFVILNADGRVVADSRSPRGNVGFPVEPFEVEYFLKVVGETASTLTPAQLAVLNAALTKLKPKATSSD